MRSPRRLLLAVFTAILIAAVAAPAGATFPFPAGTSNPYDYTQLHIADGTCPPDAGSDLPKGFNCKNDFKLTDYAPHPGDQDYDPSVENNPQELWGVKGPGTNKAWETTTGRPDTVIAVLHRHGRRAQVIGRVIEDNSKGVYLPAQKLTGHGKEFREQ